MIKTFYIAILWFLTLPLHAQDNFIIKNVKVFDGEKVIKKTSVKVEGNTIVDVSKKIKAKDGVRVLDGEGKTLIPALSNAHVHAWSPVSLKEAARAGVLNVMDMHGLETYQQFMLNVKDSTNYARFYRAGFAATAPGGHGTQFGFEVPTLKKPEEAKQFVADRKKAKVDYIKIIVEPSTATLSYETVSQLIKEAHNSGFKAVVHISRLKDAEKVIENNADGLVHIWWDKPITTEKLKALKQNQEFFIIPTLLTTIKAFEAMGDRSKAFMSKSEILAEIKKLHDFKVPILAGTDPPNLNINYSTDLYEELFLLKEAGLSNIEILKTATSNVAEAFNLKNTGYIKKGFLADMLLIDGDPAENIKHINRIEMVWKAGALVE
jgi:imidazolonepropionase-like amidohydrolase